MSRFRPRIWVCLSLIMALGLSACAAPPTATPIPKTLKLVSSLPLNGLSEAALEIVNAIALRLEQANHLACNGQYALVYESWDDASPTEKMWTMELEAANANKAVADASVVVYLGPGNSGAAKVSIPILNQAGLPMLSMGTTYPGLTKPGTGDPDEPQKYYPSGQRNFLRVITADDVQGAVAANLAKQLGVQTVYILDDGDLYGQGVANVFDRTARSLGLTVVGHTSYDPRAADYLDLMRAIATSHNGQPPDALYAGMIPDTHAAQIIKDKAAVLGDNQRVKFFGSEGISGPPLLAEVGAAAEGLFATRPGLSNENLPPLGQQFLRDYVQRFKVEPTSGIFVVAGYEAANVTLKAIENVCAAGGDPTNRRAVRDALFAIDNFQGVLGTWSFDENGDTSLTKMTIYQVRNGQLELYTK